MPQLSFLQLVFLTCLKDCKTLQSQTTFWMECQETVSIFWHRNGVCGVLFWKESLRFSLWCNGISLKGKQYLITHTRYKEMERLMCSIYVSLHRGAWIFWSCISVFSLANHCKFLTCRSSDPFLLFIPCVSVHCTAFWNMWLLSDGRVGKIQFIV